MASSKFVDDADLDGLLGKLPLAIRTKYIKQALRKAGAPVAKQYRQKVLRGDPEFTPELKQLHRLISVKVVDYNNGIFVMLVGVRVDASGEGWYAHLVEKGFQHFGTNAKRVDGKEALAPAIANTQPEQRRAMVTKMEEVIIAEGG